jgi:hypothetical protein
MRVEYEGECDLYCIDNEKTVQGQVVDFRLEEQLTCYLADSKMYMNYNKRHGLYIGSLMGKEFHTKGPKYFEVRQGRNR